MNMWGELTQAEKALLVQIYIGNGVTKLDEMLRHYDYVAQQDNTRVDKHNNIPIAIPLSDNQFEIKPYYSKNNRSLIQASGDYSTKDIEDMEAMMRIRNEMNLRNDTLRAISGSPVVSSFTPGDHIYDIESSHYVSSSNLMYLRHLDKRLESGRNIAPSTEEYNHIDYHDELAHAYLANELGTNRFDKWSYELWAKYGPRPRWKRILFGEDPFANSRWESRYYNPETLEYDAHRTVAPVLKEYSNRGFPSDSISIKINELRQRLKEQNPKLKFNYYAEGGPLNQGVPKELNTLTFIRSGGAMNTYDNGGELKQNTRTFYRSDGSTFTIGRDDKRMKYYQLNFREVVNPDGSPIENPGATATRDGMSRFLEDPRTQFAISLLPVPIVGTASMGAAKHTITPLIGKAVSQTTKMLKNVSKYPSLREANAINRVFTGGSPLQYSNPDAFRASNPNLAYRIAGKSQYDDLMLSGYLRPKVGKIKGGRSGEVHWSLGDPLLNYHPQEGRYLFETKNPIQHNQVGALRSSDLNIYTTKDGKWVPLVSELGKSSEKYQPTLQNILDKPLRGIAEKFAKRKFNRYVDSQLSSPLVRKYYQNVDAKHGTDYTAVLDDILSERAAGRSWLNFEVGPTGKYQAVMNPPSRTMTSSALQYIFSNHIPHELLHAVASRAIRGNYNRGTFDMLEYFRKTSDGTKWEAIPNPKLTANTKYYSDKTGMARDNFDNKNFYAVYDHPEFHEYAKYRGDMNPHDLLGNELTSFLIDLKHGMVERNIIKDMISPASFDNLERYNNVIKESSTNYDTLHLMSKNALSQKLSDIGPIGALAAPLLMNSNKKNSGTARAQD